MYPVSHGRHHKSSSYESSAFFIDNEETGRSFLIFGDVEADSVSQERFNRRIWKETARRIRRQVLNTIFLECSYSVSVPACLAQSSLLPKITRLTCSTLTSMFAVKQKKG